jgi:hypothetical protein
MLDAYVDAVVSFTAAFCRGALCDESLVASCVDEEYQTFGHSPEWLACAARLAPRFTEDYFRAITSRFYDLTVASAGCGSVIPTPDPHDPPPELDACDAFDRAMSGRCDGIPHRDDGADERNCDPTAAEYDCGDGSSVPWLTWCDETKDCSNGADEAVCMRGP